jgi:hypothetical protein
MEPGQCQQLAVATGSGNVYLPAGICAADTEQEQLGLHSFGVSNCVLVQV